jgi:hypothetical protein
VRHDEIHALMADEAQVTAIFFDQRVSGHLGLGQLRIAAKRGKEMGFTGLEAIPSLCRSL